MRRAPVKFMKQNIAWPLLRDILERDGRVTLPVSGGSMRPFLPGPRRLTLERAPFEDIRPGDVVGYEVAGRFFAHRAIARTAAGLRVRGDAGIGPDHKVGSDQVWGRVETVWSGRLGLFAHAVAHPLLAWGRSVRHWNKGGLACL